MATRGMGDRVKVGGAGLEARCLRFLRATSVTSPMSGCNDIVYPVGSFVVRINQVV